MKLIIVSADAADAAELSSALRMDSSVATAIASTGSVFRAAQSTLLIEVNDGRLPYVTRRVRHVCRARRVSALTPAMFGMDAPIDPDIEIEIGGATFCVVHVARFERIVPA